MVGDDIELRVFTEEPAGHPRDAADESTVAFLQRPISARRLLDSSQPGAAK